MLLLVALPVVGFITGVACVVACGAGGDHKHTLYVSDVQDGATPFAPIGMTKSTLVLWRCQHCAHVDVTPLAGRWSVAQLTGEEAGDVQGVPA